MIKKSMIKKRAVTAIGIGMAVILTGCSGELSDQYITVTDYERIKVEKVAQQETTEEEIDKVVARMMEGYVAEHDLPENTRITDEMVKGTMSDTAKTVEQYREELRRQIDAAKDKSARAELENRVWEKVIDQAQVKKYPKDRLNKVKEHLKKQYEAYAKEAGMEYEAYIKTLNMTGADLTEAAKASIKQELIAEVIAQKHALKPNDTDFQTALEIYAGEYKFANTDLLLEAVPEEEMRLLAIKDNVKAWLADRSVQVEKKS